VGGRPHRLPGLPVAAEACGRLYRPAHDSARVARGPGAGGDRDPPAAAARGPGACRSGAAGDRGGGGSASATRVHGNCARAGRRVTTPTLLVHATGTLEADSLSQMWPSIERAGWLAGDLPTTVW